MISAVEILAVAGIFCCFRMFGESFELGCACGVTAMIAVQVIDKALA